MTAEVKILLYVIIGITLFSLIFFPALAIFLNHKSEERFERYQERVLGFGLELQRSMRRNHKESIQSIQENREQLRKSREETIAFLKESRQKTNAILNTLVALQRMILERTNGTT